MKRTNLIVALALLTGLLFTSCAGVKARENVLMPAMQAAFVTVLEPAAQIGIGVAVDSGSLSGDEAEALRASLRSIGDALLSGDVQQARVIASLWREVLPLVLSGIQSRVDAGEIGPGVAQSLLETVRVFELRLIQLLGS